MTEAIIVVTITGGLTLSGTIYPSNKTAQTMNTRLDRQQTVTETKLGDLIREVREHNNFAKRTPAVEEQIKVINCRIFDLEGLHRPA